MNGTLSFYECRLSAGDTQTLPAVIEFELFTPTGGGDTKTLHSCLLAPARSHEPPCETFTTLN